MITGAPVFGTSGDQHYQSYISSILSSLLLEFTVINAGQSLRATKVPRRDMLRNPLQLFTLKVQQQKFNSPPQDPRWRKRKARLPEVKQSPKITKLACGIKVADRSGLPRTQKFILKLGWCQENQEEFSHAYTQLIVYFN